MKQLEVVVSPPAFVSQSVNLITARQVFHLCKSVEICGNLTVSIKNTVRDPLLPPLSHGSRDMNFYLVNFYLMNYFLVTDRQTEGNA